MKEARGSTVDEDTVRDRSETTHDPGDEGIGKADVGEGNTEGRPIGMIKGFR